MVLKVSDIVRSIPRRINFERLGSLGRIASKVSMSRVECGLYKGRRVRVGSNNGCSDKLARENVGDR